MCDRSFRLCRIHLGFRLARAPQHDHRGITLPIHVVHMQDKLSPHIRGSTRCTPQPLRGALPLALTPHMHMDMDMDMHNLSNTRHSPLCSKESNSNPQELPTQKPAWQLYAHHN